MVFHHPNTVKVKQMFQTDIQLSQWLKAHTLKERVVLLRDAQVHEHISLPSSALAKQLIKKWKSQSPFPADSYFEQRLIMEGISYEEFGYILDETGEKLLTRLTELPVWLKNLDCVTSSDNPAGVVPVPKEFNNNLSFEFLNLIEPLICSARKRLHENIINIVDTQKGCVPIDIKTIVDLLYAKMPIHLLLMLQRTLVLELNVARLSDLLVGDSSEERFKSYLKHIRHREVAKAILQEYPVLTQQIVIRIDNWVNFSLDFVRHLCSDWGMIKEAFNSKSDPGPLVGLIGFAGDPHRKGRSVMIAEFGSGLKVVYKPRSLDIEEHFQKLLVWLNGRGVNPPFRTMEILNCHSHGWEEFIFFRDCKTLDDLNRFYERQGALLAVFYALEATDFHYENLIASGEHPVPVDLESLFHPSISNPDNGQSDAQAESVIKQSVIRVGALPFRLWSKADYDGIDLSGMSAVSGQLWPDRLPHPSRSGTDEMHFIRKRPEFKEGQNLPTLNGTKVNITDYAQGVISGFTNMYELLMKYRLDLLDDAGPLACFLEDDVRVLLRPSRIYSLLLFESFHPDLLHDALDREQLFDKLWVGVKELPCLAKVIPHELRDLQQGDLPFFTTRPNSCDLFNSVGQRIASFFNESSMALVRRRIQRFSNSDLSRQIWFIQASFASLASKEGPIQAHTYPMPEPERIPPRAELHNRLLLAAVAVGDDLVSQAFRGKEDASWLGLGVAKRGPYEIAPLGWDLYSGIPGVALFMAYLSAITRDERYYELARAASVTLRRQIETNRLLMDTTGIFSGWGGVIYVLTHLGILWDQASLLTEAEDIAGFLPGLIEGEENHDLIDGTAGCLAGLISLYRCKPSNRILSVALQCGDRLLSCAIPQACGIGWISKLICNRPLTGFSHGVAGIALKLFELATLTGERRFREAGLSALEYERSLFSPEAKNWLDLRQINTSTHPYMTAWCHGAAGIGLARLYMLRHSSDTKIREEAEIALKTTLEQGFGKNHCLCHGDLGNLEFLYQASVMFDDSRLKYQVVRIASIILDSIKKHGWLCGVTLGVKTPGLMPGLAGIGYELLRLAEPDRVPSVLVLDPPVFG